MAQELPTGIKLYDSNDNVSRQSFNDNLQVISDKLNEGEGALEAHLAESTSLWSDYDYPLATVAGTQIQVTHESDSRVVKFELSADVSGGAITISEDEGVTDLPLLEVDGITAVTSLDKGFVEVIKDGTNFIYRPRGAKLDEIITAVEAKGQTVAEPQKVPEIVTAINAIQFIEAGSDVVIYSNSSNVPITFLIAGSARITFTTYSNQGGNAILKVNTTIIGTYNSPDAGSQTYSVDLNLKNGDVITLTPSQSQVYINTISLKIQALTSI